MNTLSPIAQTARLETAIETLAEYIGYLNSEIDTEQDRSEPNSGRVDALGHTQRTVTPRMFSFARLTYIVHRI
jgi:hypothetical protein